MTIASVSLNEHLPLDKFYNTGNLRLHIWGPNRFDKAFNQPCKSIADQSLDLCFGRSKV